MKRKRIDFEYNLVDEFLNQREKETLTALDALKKMKEPTPKKPLLAKVNVTKRNRKPHP
jgi:hypothetical protein